MVDGAYDAGLEVDADSGCVVEVWAGSGVGCVPADGVAAVLSGRTPRTGFLAADREGVLPFGLWLVLVDCAIAPVACASIRVSRPLDQRGCEWQWQKCCGGIKHAA